MQQFDDKKGQRRIINIRNMKEEDAEKLFFQYQGLSKVLQLQCTEELKREIQKASKEADCLQWILAVTSKEGKIIGKIEATSFDNQEVAIRIQIPNPNWVLKYGVEAIDQFIKICRENRYFKKIELSISDITKSYMKNYNLASNIIEVA